jgi:hypothetical protein
MRRGLFATVVLATALAAGAANADCTGGDREFVFTEDGSQFGQYHEICYGSQVNPIMTAWHFWSNLF